jgi:Response regulator containing a CheY-like receiver domain and an HTH DNA-binding domain
VTEDTTSGAEAGRITVLLADDHEIVREGLQMVLAEEEGIAVVGQARDGDEAVRLTLSLAPDVVLMDLAMPRLDGIAATRRLAESGSAARVVILTSFADDARVRDALQAGAIGYLLKDVGKTELVQAIVSAAAGRPTLHPEAQKHLIRQIASPGGASDNPLDALTDRERDVLRLLAQGRSNKEIAAELFLSVGTVKGYVSAVLNKLGVADRTQATLAAIRHGLVTPFPDSGS